MEIKELLESTPTVDICATSDETRILVRSKDVVADESGQRTEEIPGKGTVCSRMTAHLYRLLETKGFHTAFVEEVTDTESLFRREETIPLLVTVRQERDCRKAPPSLLRRRSSTVRRRVSADRSSTAMTLSR